MFDMHNDEEIDNLAKAYEAENGDVGVENLQPLTEPPHIIKNKSLLKMNKKQDSEKREDCPGDDFPVTEILTQSRQERKERQSRWKAKTLKNWIKNLSKAIVKCFHRWVNCTRDIHCDVTRFDDKGQGGEWKCNICGHHESAIVWPKPPPR